MDFWRSLVDCAADWEDMVVVVTGVVGVAGGLGAVFVVDSPVVVVGLAVVLLVVAGDDEINAARED